MPMSFSSCLKNPVSHALMVATAVAAAAATPTAPALHRAKASALATKQLQAPLRFAANRGQTDARVRFVAHTAGSVVFITDQGATVKTERGSFGLAFAQAAGTQPAALGAVVSQDHYLLGRHAAVTAPTYAQVRQQELYPGVDVTYYGNNGQLEYDLDLAPHANAQQIQIKVSGAAPRLNAAGDLVLTPGMRLLAPRAYQRVAGQRRNVSVRYTLGAKGQVGFALGAYDAAQTVVIDPVLQYASLLGGTAFQAVNGVALDKAGEAFVTGYTLSSDFPTVSPLQSALHAGTNDAFVAKFSADGGTLVYSTYLGGSGDDRAAAIAVDAAGDAYVTGTTTSTDFPTTAGAFQASVGTDGNTHGFVTVLNPAGAAEIYSTYLHGSSADQPAAIAIDGSGDAFVAGSTSSADFPVSTGAPQTTFGGQTDAFVTAINPAGSGLLYSTYFGGSASDAASSIAVDATGNAYVGGSTASTDLFVTPGALQTTIGGGFDGFVVKVDRSGRLFDYSTYFGGKLADEVNAIAVDSAGQAFIAGDTASVDIFHNTTSSTQSYQGNGDGFTAELTPNGSALVYGTFIGGSNADKATGIVVDNTDNAYVSGVTASSTDFPVTNNATQAASGGVNDAFLVKLNANGTSVLYASYYGGLSNDAGNAIAIDASGELAMGGNTSSANFPSTTGAAQTTVTDANMGFVAKFQPAAQGVFSPSALGFAAQAPKVASAGQSVTFTNGGELPLTISGITTTGPYSETDNCNANSSVLQPGASCTISVVFTPTAIGNATGTVVVADNAPGGSQTLNLSGAGGDFSVSVTPTTNTITAGASSSFGFNVTPANGYTQVVTLSCTGIDATQNATCVPSPTTLTMNGSTTSTATFTIDTTARPTLVPFVPTLPSNPWTWLAIISSALAGFVLLTRLRTQRRLGWMGAALVLASALAAAGCGGSTSNPGTAANNYTLTFTGTAGSAVHSTTVQLTVN